MFPNIDKYINVNINLLGVDLMKNKILAISLLTVMGGIHAGGKPNVPPADGQATENSTDKSTTVLPDGTVVGKQVTHERNATKDGDNVSVKEKNEKVITTEKPSHLGQDIKDVAKDAKAKGKEIANDLKTRLTGTGRTVEQGASSIGDWIHGTFINGSRKWWTVGTGAAAIGAYYLWQKYCEEQELLALEEQLAQDEDLYKKQTKEVHVKQNVKKATGSVHDEVVCKPQHKVVKVEQHVAIPSHTADVAVPATKYVKPAHTVEIPAEIGIIEPAHVVPAKIGVITPARRIEVPAEEVIVEEAYTRQVVVPGQDVTIEKTLDVTEASVVNADTEVTVATHGA